MKTTSYAAIFCLVLATTATADDEWSVFAPLSSQPPPQVNHAEWSGPVDAYVWKRLNDAGLTAAPAVDRRVWYRRVSYDLLGLPPSPEQVRQVVADPRDDELVMAEVVDRLLASPRYGERWGRHWLDVVRYADSDGFAIDKERLHLWRFRDYVIRVFNEGRPLDQFLRDQIAGDELESGDEGKVAVSFYRLGPYEADNMTPENRRQDYLNEVTSTVGSALLGLSVGCARCHDHMFDPIPQADFYRLQAFFSPLQRETIDAAYLPGEMTPAVQRRYDAAVAYRTGKKAELEKLRTTLRTRIAEHRKTTVDKITDEQLDKLIAEKKEPVTEKDAERFAELKKVADNLEPEQRFEARAVAISNPKPDGKATETFVLKNGDPFNRGDRVRPGFLTAAPRFSDELLAAVKAQDRHVDGRRRLLAKWLTDPRNPITARVLVNRIWQYHFGSGIVATANDFGVNGSGPSHPELLDYLASRLIDNGWQIKPIHRELVLSRAYRTATRHPNPKSAARKDPENRLLWRSVYRRLEAETIRDALLAVSGRLATETGGPGFYEELPTGMKRSFTFFNWDPSSEDQRRRRSIFMFQRRNLVHPMMEAFDGADLNQSCERRGNSVTATQSLWLINSKFSRASARALAHRVQARSADHERRVERMFWLALSRGPSERERNAGIEFLRERTDELEALTELSLAIFNTNEFLYLD